MYSAHVLEQIRRAVGLARAIRLTEAAGLVRQAWIPDDKRRLFKYLSRFWVGLARDFQRAHAPKIFSVISQGLFVFSDIRKHGMRIGSPRDAFEH